jgi:hypothetical protein
MIQHLPVIFRNNIELFHSKIILQRPPQTVLGAKSDFPSLNSFLKPVLLPVEQIQLVVHFSVLCGPQEHSVTHISYAQFSSSFLFCQALICNSDRKPLFNSKSFSLSITNSNPAGTKFLPPIT